VFAGADEYDVDVAVDERAVERLLSVRPDDVDTADRLTFARNVFVPLTTACRYTCTYCTYYDVPGEASLLSPDEIRERCRVGADAGCTEALFTFGDDPDDRYTEIHERLDEWGSTRSTTTSTAPARSPWTRGSSRTRTPATSRRRSSATCAR